MPAQRRTPPGPEGGGGGAAADASAASAASNVPLDAPAAAAANGVAVVKTEPATDDVELYGYGEGDEYVDSPGDDEESDEAQDKDGFVLVRLSDIRKEVQCPICLGIIKKTRTVMECLHRFCRECIDRSMRLGNNECPSCRTHCASRRSLRDDPNYDALISALYPDIEKYEEEELTFNEEERIRNRKIQASIAETYQRQAEALGKKRSSTAYARRSRKSTRTRRRDRSCTPEHILSVSDDDIKNEINGINGIEEQSSGDELSDARHKRARKWQAPRSSPARPSNADVVEENDATPITTESLNTSPLRVATREILAWGKNAARSQTRHGSGSSSNARMAKGSRTSKFVDLYKSEAQNEAQKELSYHLVLVPMEGLDLVALEKPYLCCRPSLTVEHLCKYVAVKLSRRAEEVEIYGRMDCQPGHATTKDCPEDVKNPVSSRGVEKLREEISLSELHNLVSRRHKDLELLYLLKDPC